MNISYKWLKEYIDIPYSPQELADKITMAGIEVEAMERSAEIPEGIVVGEILERNPHPDADKLSVCTVSDGQQTLQIVCGAPNCDAGKRVPLATLGTVFVDPDGGKDFVIKKTKLRGVESHGMLCSARELGLSDDHHGLLELDPACSAGDGIEQLIDIDTLYEVEITPNRPDWLSHWGIARDLAALTGNKPKMPQIASHQPTTTEFTDVVDNRDLALCPRYTARIVRNVQVKDSPDWLKRHLSAIGLKPINNIVDITNFVLHELGQPLHAFDLSLLEGPKIVVRRAGEGETIVALDEKEYKLQSDHLVIADASKPVALAGIMGGLGTGVTESTTDILLESAAFVPANIRSSSKDLGISSDSSYRFERGIDFDMVETASNRALDLILELAGGELVSELIDVKADAPARKPVRCRFDRVRQLLGCDVSDATIVRIFSDLGLGVSEQTGADCQVRPPSWRHDIEREADLIEEVARINGLDKIPFRTVSAISGGGYRNDHYIKTQRLRDELIALGLVETMNYSLVVEKAALLDPRFQLEDLVKLDNPLSLELEYLRPSLLAGMLESIEYNTSRKNNNLALFEIGNTYCGNPAIFSEERRELCIALTGCKHPERYSDERNQTYDFFDLKGLIEAWFDKRRLTGYSFRKTTNPAFAASACAEIIMHNKPIGILGQVSDRLTKSMKTRNPLYLAQIQLEPLLKLKDKELYYQPISPYPSVVRDVAFVCDESLEHSEIVAFIEKLKLKSFAGVELFDIFRDESLGNNKKSLAYSLTFCNPERTLTDKEVNKAYELLRKKLEAELKVSLR